MATEIKETLVPGEPSFADSISKIYNKHAADIGHVAINWNALHEQLAEIFTQIVTPDNHDIGFAAWHALRSDRAQRDMLEAVVIQRFGNENRFVKDVRWALGQLNPLEDERDTTIHSPYTVMFDIEAGLKFISSYFTGHRRARKLEGRDLKLEFESLIERLVLLKTFINHLTAHIDDDGTAETWPSRPRLPRPAHPMSHTEQSPQTKNK